MNLKLIGLALMGLKAAASARQRQRYAVVAVAGAFAACAMLVAIFLLGWSVFLGFGQIIPLPWAAAAAAGSMLALAGAIGGFAYRYRPSTGNEVSEVMQQVEPLVKQRPGTALMAAAVLGGLASVLLKR